MAADLIAVRCYKCKEPFGLTSSSYESLQRSGHNFHCPWGHVQHFLDGPTDAEKARAEADKMRRERDRLTQQLAEKDDEIRAQSEWRAAAQRQASAMKGVATRLKNRAAAGVCPCCNRSFENLRRHMEAKHKSLAAANYAPDGTLVQ